MSKWSPSPYPLGESLGWLKRNIFGPTSHNPSGVVPLPNETKLNEVPTRYRLAFIGDIMGLRGKKLKISAELQSAVKNCDFLIGNFEGVVTTGKKRFPWDQIHNPQTLRSLAEWFPPHRTFFSVANNHSGDFGMTAFQQSVEILRQEGFNVFGETSTPSIDPAPELRIFTGTQWSNRPGAPISFLNNIDINKKKDNSLNILFPHWGYELENFPRAETVSLGYRYLSTFDAVIGHHSHTPQPATAVRLQADSPPQLLVYSLGDFCFYGWPMAPYAYGQIIIINVGPDPAGRWRIGDIRTIRTKIIHSGELHIRPIDSI